MTQRQFSHWLPGVLVVQAMELFLCLLLTACGDYTEELPGGYLLVSEGPDDQFLIREHGQKASEPYVPCNVVAYASDAHFIVARQIARSDCPFGDARQFRQSIGVTYFWVIDVDRHVFHGPIAVDDFQERAVALGVPPALREANPDLVRLERRIWDDSQGWFGECGAEERTLVAYKQKSR